MGTPPLPAGYALDTSGPPLPVGYKIDEPDHNDPNSFWDRISNSGDVPGKIQQLTASLADWAQRKSQEKQTENLSTVAKGRNPQSYSSAEMASDNYDLLARGARFISNALEPKNVALGAGIALANTNPVTGVPVDAALVAHGGYGVLKNAPEALKGNPEAAEVALLSGAEMAGGAAGVGGQAGRIRPAAAALAPKLYQSALKPPPGSYSSAEVQSMVKTGLENKIPVSAEGAAKLSGLLKDLHGAVQEEIDAGAARGATVNKYAVASRLGKTSKQFATQVNPEADLDAVSESGNEFLRSQPNQIPASQAQKIKTGTYQQLGDKAYGELSSATIEAQKALARGIKEELETQFPEIKGLNAAQSKLYDLQPALERAVRRIENHDIISLGSKVSAGAGAALGGAPGAVAASTLEKVLGMPMVKSKLAIALNAAGKGKTTFGAANARVGAYTAALANASQQSDDNGPVQ